MDNSAAGAAGAEASLAAAAGSRPVGVDHDLDLIFRQLTELRELAADPDKAKDSGRVYDFSIRWGTLLAGRLQRLAHYHGRGELAPDAQARYDALRAELRDTVALADGLGLARPAVPLDDAPLDDPDTR